MDYLEAKRTTLTAIQGIGRRVEPANYYCGLSLEQRRKLQAPNFMTPERWEVRELAGRAILVEISWGTPFLGNDMIGLTVFCKGELAGNATEWDHSLSKVVNTPGEVAEYLATLHNGGRDRIEALAKQNA